MKFVEHEVEWTDEKTARLWNYYQQAPEVSDLYFGLHNGRHVSHLIDSWVRFAKINRIIDLSCGRGDIINACVTYLKNGQEIFGTDFSKSSVDFVNSRFKDMANFKNAVYIESFPTPFQRGEFDLVISTEVVEHLRDDELDSMMYEANRLLADRGYIFITTPNEENLVANKVLCPDCGGKFHRWQHLRSWNANSLAERMEKYGFQTKLAAPTAWGETAFKRIAFKLAVKLNMKTETGLVYIGQKRAL